MEAMESYAQVESLQQTIYQGEGNTILLIDKLEEKVNQSEQVLNRLFLEEILGKLEGEERELIYQRYFQEKTQSVIAKEMGISQVQVSRMEKRILRKIQEEGERIHFDTYYLQKKGSGRMAGKKWWIWLLAILTAAGVLVVLLMQQNMPEKQKGGTLVQRQEATCYG